MLLSLEPVEKIFEFQAIDPTLALWPANVLNLETFTGSQTYTVPLVDPTAKSDPSLDHETEVIV